MFVSHVNYMRAPFGDDTHILTRRLLQDQLEGLLDHHPVRPYCGDGLLRRPESVRRVSATETEADADADDMPSPTEQLRELRQEAHVKNCGFLGCASTPSFSKALLKSMETFIKCIGVGEYRKLRE